jgi:hypothetical protein
VFDGGAGCEVIFILRAWLTLHYIYRMIRRHLCIIELT